MNNISIWRSSSRTTLDDIKKAKAHRDREMQRRENIREELSKVTG